MYRFEKLDIMLYPSSEGYAAAYIAGITDQATPTLDAVLNNENNKFVPSTLTVPQRLRVSRNYLIGETANKFWKGAQGTQDLWDAVQGQLLIARQSGTAAILAIPITIRATCRFAAVAAPVLVPRPSPPLRIASASIPTTPLSAASKPVGDIEECHLRLCNCPNHFA